MASRWLFRPLPLRERVGRWVAPVNSTLRTRRLVVPSPLTPTLSRKGRGSQKSLRTRALLLFQRYWPLPRPTNWLQIVNQPQTEAEVAALRCCVNRGRPFGDPNWVTDAAKRLGLE